jgi:Gp49-like protein DUF891
MPEKRSVGFRRMPAAMPVFSCSGCSSGFSRTTGSPPRRWGRASKRFESTQNEYRVIYVAKFEEAVYVLHAFSKKTQKTARKDIELAKTRYRQLLNERGKQGWK